MNESRKKEIGRNIERLRKRSGMNKSELARLLDKTPAAISQYESGITTPRIGVIEDMARIFNVKKSAILGTGLSEEVDPREAELMNLWATLDERGRSILLDLARSLSQSAGNQPEGMENAS